MIRMVSASKSTSDLLKVAVPNGAPGPPYETASFDQTFTDVNCDVLGPAVSDCGPNVLALPMLAGLR